MRSLTVGLVCGLACGASLMPPRLARAADGWTAPPAPAGTAADLLRAGDAALNAGDRGAAQAAFDRVVREFPASPEANEARRALQALALPAVMPGGAALPAAPPTAAPPAVPGADMAYPQRPPNRDIVIRNEPYSLRTSERLRLTAWEKLDFGVTSFIYGASLGVSLGIAEHANDVGPVVLGAVGYTAASVAFLAAANPDRGDLPLALGIVSYVPMTTLLVSAAAYPHGSSRSQAAATAISSVLSVPIAVVAARNLELDPGDTQLVRDAGFWGLVLSVTGTLALGTHHYSGGDVYGDTSPSTRSVATAGLVGLYGGLGLGLLAATHTEVSLERVRVTTWGGYGGAVLGALIGASDGNGERGLWGGITIGSLVGLGVTLLATSGMDGIPPESTPVAAATSSWAPVVTASANPTGRHVPLFGVGGNLF